MIAAAAITVEMLRFQPETPRAGGHFDALLRSAAGAGVRVAETGAYSGASDWLMLWGPGGAGRKAAMERQVASGGHAICLDLSYWAREKKARVSIDAPHPQAWVMKHDWPADRFRADRVPVMDVWNPKGPVIIAGIGRKARAQYESDTVLAWELSMLAECRARGKKVFYRKKQADAPTPQDVPLLSTTQPIDTALKGASLVVTWHSNVAVDAIRNGIPVVCQDGAAAAVCPSELPDDPLPLPAPVRDKFLWNLAHFQWATGTEAPQMWAWLQELLS